MMVKTRSQARKEAQAASGQVTPSFDFVPRAKLPAAEQEATMSIRYLNHTGEGEKEKVFYEKETFLNRRKGVGEELMSQPFSSESASGQGKKYMGKGKPMYPPVKAPPPLKSSKVGAKEIPGFFGVVMAGVVIVLCLALLFSMRRPASAPKTNAEHDEVDYRVKALGILRAWVKDLKLPVTWDDELDNALAYVETSGSRDPKAGAGILLPCNARENCRKLMDRLQGDLVHERFKKGEETCILKLDHTSMVGDDLAGQVQHKMVEVLQPCSKAVVLINDADTLPYKAAKVLTTALSEMGSFVNWGEQVPSTEALYLLFMTAESDANLAAEELVKGVKAKFAASLAGAKRLLSEGEANTSMASVNAGALRRRIQWVIPVDALK